MSCSLNAVNKSKQKILILGANGHLGFNTLEIGTREGLTILGTVRDSKWRDLEPLAKYADQLHTADLLDFDSLVKAFNGIDVVLHLAAPKKVWSKDPAKEIFAPIVEGTKNVFWAAKRAGVKRIVMSSSCSALGLRTHKDQLTEDDWNFNVSSPLLKAKIDAEKWAWENYQEFNLEFFSLCMPNVIGPHFLRSSANSQFIENLYRGFVMPFPKVSFHFVDVRDAAWAHLQVATTDLPSQRFVIAGDFVDNEAIYRAAKAVRPNAFGSKQPIPFVALQVASRMESWISKFHKRERQLPADLLSDFKDLNQRVSDKKARELLGWQPRDLQMTLRDSMDWLESNPPIDR